jgi:hypothetical protein
MQAKLNPRGGEAGESLRYAHDEGDSSMGAPLLAASSSVVSTRTVTNVVLAMENFGFCDFSRNGW